MASYARAPTLLRLLGALKDLKNILHPPRKMGAGYKYPGLDPFVRIRLEAMQTMLSFYTNEKSATYEKWGTSALQAAISLQRGRYCARQLARLSRQFILDCSVLPVNPYGEWNESMLADEDLTVDINLHLQELGKNISAMKIVKFLAQPDVKEKHGITKQSPREQHAGISRCWVIASWCCHDHHLFLFLSFQLNTYHRTC